LLLLRLSKFFVLYAPGSPELNVFDSILFNLRLSKINLESNLN